VPAALDEHRIVAGESLFPADTGRFRALPAFDAIGSSYAAGVLFTTKEFSANHPAAVRALARICNDAAVYCNADAHLTETMELVSEFTG